MTTPAATPGVPLEGEHLLLPMDKVAFGPGAVRRIPDELARLGASRALIVTGRTLATTTSLVDDLAAILGDRSAGVFSETRAHVPRASVIACADAIRAAGADAIVSFGGGTPNDTAKLAALCIAADVHDEQGLDALRFRVEGDRTIVPELPAGSIPHIAVPTTLSGGEFTLWGGSTDTVRGVKDAYGAPHLTPRVVVLDPEVTLATPDRLWASTAMRAMDHAVETICSPGHNPFADALALQAVGLLVRGLDAFRTDREDLAARGSSQLAAWMSITSLPSVPAGLSHAIGHQLGGRFGVPHGVTSCIVLPAVMDFNRPVTRERQMLLASAMGIERGARTDDAFAAAAADRLRELVVGIGIQPRIRDWGVARQDLASMADEVLLDFMAATNPRRVDSSAEVLELLESVY